MAPDLTDREFVTRKLMQSGVNIFRRLLDWDEWKTHIKIFAENLVSNEDIGECVAKEVFRFREPNGYFGTSLDPRLDRKGVKYRIGQVIKHKKYGYRGVIIGWDKTTKAPDFWIYANHLKPDWRHQPNYSVLVDVNDRSDVQTTYVVEENLEIISGSQVEHPEIDDFFSHFDGAQYHPRPWLKELYPRD